MDSAADRWEDVEELKWLLAECRAKRELLEGTRDEALQPGVFYKQWDLALQQKLDGYDERPESCTLTDFLQAKYEIRTLLKQLAGMLSSTDWQSPSFTQGKVKEQGVRQKEQNVYLRTGGSETVDRYEREFFHEYYEMRPEVRSQSLGLAAISGMKALEIALLAYKDMTGADLPILYQAGYYYEGVQLLRRLYPESQPIALPDIYERLERGEETGCLLLEPGVTWPVHEGVDQDRLFSALSRHRQETPLFIVVDRTLTGMANPLFEKYAHQLPEHVVLVSIESAIKYYQYGMELTNLGFAVFCGKRILDAVSRETIVEFAHLLSGVPDPSLIWRLPSPSFEHMEKRLARVARNVEMLTEFFQEFVKEGKISNIYHSVQSSTPLYVGDQRWLGSILYLQVPPNVTYQEYERLALDWVRLSDPSLHIHYGGSFGFDSMRINALESPPEKEYNCALRLSVGRDTADDLKAKMEYFRRLLSGEVEKQKNCQL